MDGSIQKSFGLRIAEARQSNGLSQEKLGERLGKGGDTVGRWERGERFPDPEQMGHIATALDVPLWWLFAGENSSSDGEIEHDDMGERRTRQAALIAGVHAALEELEAEICLDPDWPPSKGRKFDASYAKTQQARAAKTTRDNQQLS